jgi:hypothetical protein
MRRFQNARWIAAAIVIGALIAPGGVVSAATTSLTTIAGKSGVHTASVTGASQLLATESDPKSAVSVRGSIDPSSSCQAIYTVPAGKALVIKTVVFNATFAPADTDGALVLNTANASGPCDGPTLAVATLDRSQGLAQTLPEDLGGEVIVPQNTVVDILHSGISGNGGAQIYGYTIPAAAAPATAASAN